jgi:5-methylcytosine-specific restriction endonuclease McrA
MSAIVRTCYRCRVERPPTDFIEKKNGALYEMCSPCLSEILKGSDSKRRKVRLPHTTVDRVCYLCSRRQPNAAFTRRSNGTYFSACKDCNKNVFAHRRRARMLAVGGSFSTAEWLDLLARHPICPRCQRRWEDIPIPAGRRSPVSRDHIVAISKGGQNTIENIQPLCFSCNSRKGNR